MQVNHLSSDAFTLVRQKNPSAFLSCVFDEWVDSTLAPYMTHASQSIVSNLGHWVHLGLPWMGQDQAGHTKSIKTLFDKPVQCVGRTQTRVAAWNQFWKSVVACLCVCVVWCKWVDTCIPSGGMSNDIYSAHSCWPKPIQIDWIKGWIRGVAWSSTAGTVAMVWSPNSHYLLKDTIMILSKRF